MDEKAYPPIIAPSRGLEMDFANDSSNSLSIVNTMELKISSKPKIKIEWGRPEINGEDDDETRGLGPDENEDDDDDLNTIYQPPRNPELTPPTSTPGSTLPLPSGARRNPTLAVKPVFDAIQGTTEPPNAAGEKTPISIGNILGKLGKGELTTAMDKRRKPRGKLQGKATSNLSSYNNFSRASSVSSSCTGSIPPSQQGNRPEVKNPKRKYPHTPDKQHEELSAPSQAITYEDPEAEKERKSVRAKLSGDAFGVETPKPTRSAAKRIKTAVDMEGTVTRRTKRNK